MPIVNCTHTFDELTASVLPAHCERLKAAMQTPMPASTFVGYKSASREALARAGRTTDFPGCYVFIDKDRPVCNMTPSTTSSSVSMSAKASITPSRSIGTASACSTRRSPKLYAVGLLYFCHRVHGAQHANQ
jgi:hypothetical protein